MSNYVAKLACYMNYVNSMLACRRMRPNYSYYQLVSYADQCQTHMMEGLTLNPRRNYDNSSCCNYFRINKTIFFHINTLYSLKIFNLRWVSTKYFLCCLEFTIFRLILLIFLIYIPHWWRRWRIWHLISTDFFHYFLPQTHFLDFAQKCLKNLILR